jgi:hypothetical protein
MIFYEDTPSRVIRQGDVIQGLPMLNPSIKGDPLSSALQEYQIEVSVCLCAVITPCCSIEEGQIALSPLRPLEARFVKNEFFKENPLLMNVKVDAEHSMGPAMWETLSAGEKANRLAIGKAYCWRNLFTYDESPLFSQYTLRGKKMRNQYIDFRKTFFVKWDQIKRDWESATQIKLAELSVEARASMREKLTSYYERVPDEDRAVLAAS